MIYISILIASYNCEKKISDTIKSAYLACKKENIKFEIVVVDDNSSDQTFNILKKIKNKFKFLTIFKNKKNIGFSYSILKAARIAKGEKIKILHSSDIESTKDIQNYLKSSKTYDMVLTNFIDKRKLFRKILSQFCSKCFCIVSGKNIKYFNSSILCNRRSFLDQYPENFKGNFFLSIIIAKLLLMNRSYTEVEVSQKHPKTGSKAVSLVNLYCFFHALMIVLAFRIFNK